MQDISLILTLIGVTTTVCFQFSLTFSGYGQRRHQALNRRASIESRGSYRRIDDDEDTERQQRSQQQPIQAKKNFFKSPRIYQNGLLYVFSRLFTTTALVYIPLWLDERLVQARRFPSSDSSVEHIALIPMATFISSFLSSLLIERTNRVLGHHLSYLLGSMFCIAGCIIVELTVSALATNFRLYSIAILFGAGSSVTMISSLCMIADMIGKHADQGGFVYSAVTFADKLITGIAIVIIASL